MSRLKQFALGVVSTALVATNAYAGVANTGSLGVGSQVATQGDTNVAITISADTVTNSTINGVTILTFSILFDVNLCAHMSNISVVAAGRTTGTPELSGMGCPGTGSAMFNLAVEGTTVVLPDGSGPIMTWLFDLSGSAPTGDFPLTVSDESASSGPIAVGLTTSPGQLTIESSVGPTSTPVDTPTATSTATATDIATAIPPTDVPTQAPPTDVPTQAPPTDVPTQAPPTDVPTQAPPTSSPTQAPPTSTPTVAPPTGTPTEVPPTDTPTSTPTASNTPTASATFTVTNTPTNTPIPTPRVTSGASDGSSNISGSAAGNANVEVRTSPGGDVLGSGTAGPDGRFSIFLNRQLSAPETIQVFDTTNGLQGDLVQIDAPPAPIPAVDPIGAAILVLLMVAGLAWRVGLPRRD